MALIAFLECFAELLETCSLTNAPLLSFPDVKKAGFCISFKYMQNLVRFGHAESSA